MNRETSYDSIADQRRLPEGRTTMYVLPRLVAIAHASYDSTKNVEKVLVQMYVILSLSL